MATLSSAIVKAHVASMREVEEALARQVIYGGDLVTNLLELALASEHLLTPLLAESHHLPPAPSGELARAPDELLRLVPAELTSRHSFYPLGEHDGVLVIAVSEPLPADVESDLSFSLGVRIEQRVAPLVRIRQALARDYGVPLDRRMLRLVAKLEGRADPSPSSMPAPLRDGAAGFPALPRPASVPPIDYPAATTQRSSEPVRPPGAPAAGASARPAAEPRVEAPATPAAPGATTGEAAQPSEKVPASASALPRWLVGAPGRERGRKRHRGPYTAAQAEQDLMEAESRDDVLGAFFDFASQYFEYSALFAVQGDVAEGRDAHGPGADRARIRGIGVPLDLPSSLAAVKQSLSLRLGPLGRDGIDRSFAEDLQRKGTHSVLLLPVVVRGRAVLLLYGDHGEADVLLADIGDVIAFAPLVAAALERLIVKKKRGARASGELPAPRTAVADPGRRRHRLPGVEQRVEALARALGSTTTPSSPPTTAHASPQAKGLQPAGPETLAASPRAGPASAGELALAQPPSADVPSEVPATPAQSTLGEGLGPAGPETVAASPRALAGAAPMSWASQADDGTGDDEAPSQAPSTRAETPAASGRRSPAAAVLAVGGPRRQDTPPQGTLGAHEAPQDQPFPLTRRTPSTRPVDAAGASPAEVDAGWDVEADARAAPGPFGVPEVEARSDVGHEAPLAPASRQLALGPRPPFPRQDAKDRLLPSVIVDVDADCRELLRRLIEGDESAGDRLLEIGDPAVSVLVAEFPGPVNPDRARAFAEAGARASDCGPVLRTIARVGPVAVPFLVVRTADRDPSVRRWATWLLGELPCAEAARAVVRRFSDSDAEVRRAALAAGRMMQSDAEARTALRDGLATLASEPSRPPEVRHGAIEALADLRDPRAVPRLVPLLDSEDPSLVASAHRALVTLARQDFGRDGKAWTGWWRANSGRHRIEWLIDALVAESLELRREAGEELKSLTREYFGYYEDLPPKERERAQRAYRQWWESTGKARFS